MDKLAYFCPIALPPSTFPAIPWHVWRHASVASLWNYLPSFWLDILDGDSLTNPLPTNTKHGTQPEIKSYTTRMKVIDSSESP